MKNGLLNLVLIDTNPAFGLFRLELHLDGRIQHLLQHPLETGDQRTQADRSSFRGRSVCQGQEPSRQVADFVHGGYDAVHIFLRRRVTRDLPFGNLRVSDDPHQRIGVRVDNAVCQAAYRGHAFAWQVLPGWQGPLPPMGIEWIAFRRAPLQNQHIILWARSDAFPGGELEFEEGPSGLEEDLFLEQDELD